MSVVIGESLALSACEVAEMLDVAECTVRRWARDGMLRAVTRWGSTKPMMFMQEDVERFVMGLPPEAAR